MEDVERKGRGPVPFLENEYCRGKYRRTLAQERGEKGGFKVPLKGVYNENSYMEQERLTAS